jgi:hypothetical protein
MNNWTCSKCNTSYGYDNLICKSCGQHMLYLNSEEQRINEFNKLIPLEEERKKFIKIAYVIFISSFLLGIILLLLKINNNLLIIDCLFLVFSGRYIRKNSTPLVEFVEVDEGTLSSNLNLSTNVPLTIYKEKYTKFIITASYIVIAGLIISFCLLLYLNKIIFNKNTILLFFLPLFYAVYYLVTTFKKMNNKIDLYSDSVEVTVSNKTNKLQFDAMSNKVNYSGNQLHFYMKNGDFFNIEMNNISNEEISKIMEEINSKIP